MGKAETDVTLQSLGLAPPLLQETAALVSKAADQSREVVVELPADVQVRNNLLVLEVCVLELLQGLLSFSTRRVAFLGTDEAGVGFL